MKCCIFDIDLNIDEIDFAQNQHYPHYQLRSNHFEPLLFIPFYFDNCQFFSIDEPDVVVESKNQSKLENIQIKIILQIFLNLFKIPCDTQFQVIKILYPDVSLENFIPINIYIKLTSVFYNYEEISQFPFLIYFYFCACFNQNYCFNEEIAQFLPNVFRKKYLYLKKSYFLKKCDALNQPKIELPHIKSIPVPKDRLVSYDDTLENELLESRVRTIFGTMEEYLILDAYTSEQ
eukprot:EST43796.1 Hypothetical protein SS50377_16414 [Spironucleus salmonicida]